MLQLDLIRKKKEEEESSSSHITFDKRTAKMSVPARIFIDGVNAMRAGALGHMYLDVPKNVLMHVPWESRQPLPPYMQGYYEAYQAFYLLATVDGHFNKRHGIQTKVTWADLDVMEQRIRPLLEPLQYTPSTVIALPYTALATNFTQYVLPLLRADVIDTLKLFAEHIDAIRHIQRYAAEPHKYPLFIETGAYIVIKQ